MIRAARSEAFVAEALRTRTILVAEDGDALVGYVCSTWAPRRWDAGSAVRSWRPG